MNAPRDRIYKRFSARLLGALLSLAAMSIQAAPRSGQDGIWNGQRPLPEGFVQFVRTRAQAWEADGRAMYAGFVG